MLLNLVIVHWCSALELIQHTVLTKDLVFLAENDSEISKFCVLESKMTISPQIPQLGMCKSLMRVTVRVSLVSYCNQETRT